MTNPALPIQVVLAEHIQPGDLMQQHNCNGVWHPVHSNMVSQHPYREIILDIPDIEDPTEPQWMIHTENGQHLAVARHNTVPDCDDCDRHAEHDVNGRWLCGFHAMTHYIDSTTGQTS